MPAAEPRCAGRGPGAGERSPRRPGAKGCAGTRSLAAGGNDSRLAGHRSRHHPPSRRQQITPAMSQLHQLGHLCLQYSAITGSTVGKLRHKEGRLQLQDTHGCGSTTADRPPPANRHDWPCSEEGQRGGAGGRDERGHGKTQTEMPGTRSLRQPLQTQLPRPTAAASYAQGN